METMSGRSFFSSRARISSRQIASLAVAEPPGLSMRRTMARTDKSLRASRIASMSVSEPTVSPLSGSKPPCPPTIAPEA